MYVHANLALHLQEKRMSVREWHDSLTILFNSLPNDKILDRSRSKAFADDKINVAEKLKFV